MKKKKASYFYVFNVKVLTGPNGHEFDYGRVLEKAFEASFIERVAGDKHMQVASCNKSTDGYSGEIVRFVKVDGDSGYNFKNKRKASVSLEPFTGLNDKWNEYHFFPEMHRFVVFSNPSNPISVRYFEKFFKAVFEVYSADANENILPVEVYVYKDSKLISDILGSQGLKSVKVDLTYTNGDSGPDLIQLIPDDFRSSNAQSVRLEQKPPKGGLINPNEGKILGAFLTLSKENGRASGKYVDATGKDQPFDTDDAPKRFSLVYSLISELRNFVDRLRADRSASQDTENE